MKISKIAAKSLKFKSQQYGISYEKLRSVYEQGLNEYFVALSAYIRPMYDKKNDCMLN